ncbi:MAG: glycosyltransferase family 4 protein [Verrucomicrobia bacterium]|nr:glycosyltransferase family 4 protein [Verrucomicrobiota bacterium]
MKIAQVAPLYESVPPKLDGGTERVISYLTDELVRQGHEVTLFASGDSVTCAKLVPVSPRALRLEGPHVIDPIAHHIRMLELVYRRVHDFDLVHFHLEYLHFPLATRCTAGTLTTLHGRLDIPDLMPLFKEFRNVNVVSVSNAQRKPLNWAHWRGTVYHGLPVELYKLHQEPGSYLAFLGRISPEKRVDRAIEIARKTGVELKIAAKVDAADRDYFDSKIKPLLANPLIHFIGEIGEAEKNEFLGNALAVLFPIDWPEPFGLVMIEAMACGTPTIAYRSGSVPEVLEDKKSGFIVDNLAEAVHAVKRIPHLSRRACREVFEQRFSARRMARDYVAIYEAVLSDEKEFTADKLVSFEPPAA